MYLLRGWSAKAESSVETDEEREIYSDMKEYNGRVGEKEKKDLRDLCERNKKTWKE